MKVIADGACWWVACWEFYFWNARIEKATRKIIAVARLWDLAPFVFSRAGF